MGYNYNKSEHKLLQEVLNRGDDFNGIFIDSYTTPYGDMIKFVDKYNNNELSKILSARRKFLMERDRLPKDGKGNIRKYALRDWIQDNKYQSIFDAVYFYGMCHIANTTRFIQCLNTATPEFDHFNDIIVETFNKTLNRLYFEEVEDVTSKENNK